VLKTIDYQRSGEAVSRQLKAMTSADEVHAVNTSKDAKRTTFRTIANVQTHEAVATLATARLIIDAKMLRSTRKFEGGMSGLWENRSTMVDETSF